MVYSLSLISSNLSAPLLNSTKTNFGQIEGLSVVTRVDQMDLVEYKTSFKASNGLNFELHLQLFIGYHYHDIAFRPIGKNI
jgi:hypothetical protein